MSKNGRLNAVFELENSDFSAISTENQWQNALEQYVNNKKATLTFKGAEYYTTHATLLSRWAQEQGIPLNTFGKRHIDKYMVFRRTSVSYETVRKDCVVAKNFMYFCKGRDLIATDKLADYKTPRQIVSKKVAPPAATLTEICLGVYRYYGFDLEDKKLDGESTKGTPCHFMATKESKFYFCRMRSIIALAIDSGCRIAELLDVRFRDIPAITELPENRNPLNSKQMSTLLTTAIGKTWMMQLRFTKNKKAREVPFKVLSAIFLRRYLKVRPPQYGTDPDDYVFVGVTGERATYSTMRRGLANLQKFLDIEQPVTHHGFRRYCLSRIGNDNIEQAQQIAGHSDPSTTYLYITPDKQKMIEAHAKADPMGHIMPDTDPAATIKPTRGKSLFRK